MRKDSIIDVNIYQLQLLLAAAKECNFSRATETMHITQPGLSKRIKILEDILGVALFDRTKRPIELTPAGKELCSRVKPCISDLEDTLIYIRDEYSRVNSQLSVGIFESAQNMDYLKNAGESLRAEMEGVAFSSHYVPPLKYKPMLNAGEIDIMVMLIMDEPFFDEGWQWERIMEVPKLACMLKTNPLSKKDTITYEDLRTQRFIILSRKVFPTHYTFIREQTMKHAGFEPIVARYSNSIHNMIPDLCNNDEVVICDMYLRDVFSANIKQFELPSTLSGLNAIWRKNNKNPLIIPYIKLVRKHLKEMYPEYVVEA